MAKETYYFSHDFSARNDPKMQKLMRKHGMAGIGLYWCIIELLNEEGGYLLLSQCEDYAFALRTQCDLISSLINDFLLFENDGEKFWSESVLRRIDKRNEKSVKAKLSADKRWQDANAMRTHTNRNAIKERKGKEIEKNKSADAPEIFLPDEIPEINPARPPHAPPWDSVKHYFTSLNEPTYAISFFRHHESAGWVDKYGRAIAHWPSLASGWISNDKSKAKKAAETEAKKTEKADSKEKSGVKTAAELIAEREQRRLNHLNPST